MRIEKVIVVITGFFLVLAIGGNCTSVANIMGENHDKATTDDGVWTEEMGFGVGDVIDERDAEHLASCRVGDRLYYFVAFDNNVKCFQRDRNRGHIT